MIEIRNSSTLQQYANEGWITIGGQIIATVEAESLVGIDLRQSNLPHADFQKADLRRADFTQAKLEGAHFENADLSEANFEGAHLWAAGFRGACLRQTNFANASLVGHDFKEWICEKPTCTMRTYGLPVMTKRPSGLRRLIHKRGVLSCLPRYAPGDSNHNTARGSRDFEQRYPTNQDYFNAQ